MFWTYCDDARVHYILPVRLGSEVCQLLKYSPLFALYYRPKSQKNVFHFFKKVKFEPPVYDFLKLESCCLQSQIKNKAHCNSLIYHFWPTIAVKDKFAQSLDMHNIGCASISLTALKYQDHSALKFSEVCPTLEEMNTW